MNEFDDLDVLERELGPSLRRALRHVAADITDDRPPSVVGLNGDGARTALVEDPLEADAAETDHSVNEVAGCLDALRTRSSNVTLVDTEPTSTRPPRRRWAIIAAAAAVVAVVVSGLVLAARHHAGDPQVPVAPNTTVAPGPPAEEQAVGLADAMHIWRYDDPDEAMRHLSDELIAETADGTRAGYRLESRMLNALGEQHVNVRCAAVDESAAGIVVSCTYDSHTLRSEESGLPPFTGGVQTVTIRDDTIVAFGEFDREPDGARGHFAQMRDDFRQWVSDRYPDDVPVMYEGSGWRLTEESIALWERRTLEWAEEQARARVGFIGLPPEGATPSTPETGELVVFLHDTAQGGGDTTGGRSRVGVYADGRLIWQLGRNLPEGANAQSTGYLEQHLTPEGIELIRSEVRALGLSGEDLELSLDVPVPCTSLWVPHGERLLRVSYCGDPPWPVDSQAATEDQTRALLRLAELLAVPQSSLPASAWQDQTIRAYVPSGYGICLNTSDPHATSATTIPGEPPPEPDPAPLFEQLLTLLPAPAAEVLRGSDTVTNVAGGPECLAVTTDEARLLDQALNDAGAEQFDFADSLYYHLHYPGQDGAGVGISFEPRFPDGMINCSACG